MFIGSTALTAEAATVLSTEEATATLLPTATTEAAKTRNQNKITTKTK
jgi:hypothetical protein